MQSLSQRGRSPTKQSEREFRSNETETREKLKTQQSATMHRSNLNLYDQYIYTMGACICMF